MNILSELQTVLAPLSIPFETGVFTGEAPDQYIVIVPMVDTFELHADDKPNADIQEARLAFYSKQNYMTKKNQIVKALLQADFTIIERQYIGFETETGYHHYNVDVAKNYEMED
jgi:hypothetical protein